MRQRIRRPVVCSRRQEIPIGLDWLDAEEVPVDEIYCLIAEEPERRKNHGANTAVRCCCLRNRRLLVYIPSRTTSTVCL
jgi:hypothetical protein